MNKKQIIKMLASVDGTLEPKINGYWVVRLPKRGLCSSIETLEEVAEFIRPICPKPKIGRPGKPTKQIWFPCPDDLHKRLQKEADKTKTKLSELIVKKLKRGK